MEATHSEYYGEVWKAIGRFYMTALAEKHRYPCNRLRNRTFVMKEKAGDVFLMDGGARGMETC
jgi:hypothetical protein